MQIIVRAHPTQMGVPKTRRLTWRGAPPGMRLCLAFVWMRVQDPRNTPFGVRGTLNTSECSASALVVSPAIYHQKPKSTFVRVGQVHLRGATETTKQV